jgi:hypothetical protein
MLEGMNLRRFVPDTQREYIRAVKSLAAFLGPGITVTPRIKPKQSPQGGS